MLVMHRLRRIGILNLVHGGCQHQAVVCVLGYRRKQCWHAQPSNFDVVLGLAVFVAHFYFLDVDHTIINLSTQKRILIEIAQMRLLRIDSGISVILDDLLLLLVARKPTHHLVIKLHFAFCLIDFRHHCRIKVFEAGLVIKIYAHFAEHLHEFF